LTGILAGILAGSLSLARLSSLAFTSKAGACPSETPGHAPW